MGTPNVSNVEVCPECRSSNYRVVESSLEHQTVYECLEPMCNIRWYSGGGVLYPLFTQSHVETD